ncbi:Short-chain dehydrogenase [Streptomyces hygroscopicus subsp. limoneus]|nr:Short-chain dehydrogenase [Streptomyces hygroscopicus subsp. limoneus]
MPLSTTAGTRSTGPGALSPRIILNSQSEGGPWGPQTLVSSVPCWVRPQFGLDQFGALGLVLNAIVLWTKKYIDAAIARLRADGHGIRDEDIARLSRSSPAPESARPLQRHRRCPGRRRPAPCARYATLTGPSRTRTTAARNDRPSSGIGEATAAYLAERGAQLVLGARREDRLNAVVDGITAKGRTATGVIVDVTRREDLQRLTDTALNQYGRLDVLVSNAGTMAVSPFDDLRQDDWDAMVSTHITGLLNGIGAALPVFRRQRFGQFVNVGSTAAYVVKPPRRSTRPPKRR